MIVNKVQGQSLDIAGIDLHQPAFIHCQLYVALSRVTELQGLKVLLLEEHGRMTQNIVYPEVLIQGMMQILFIKYLTLLPISYY